LKLLGAPKGIKLKGKKIYLIEIPFKLKVAAYILASKLPRLVPKFLPTKMRW
jgi:hypothetical protein